MSTKVIIISLLMSMPVLCRAGEGPRLKGYIDEALKNSNTIREQQFQLERSMEALKEARTLFLPGVAVLGSYTGAAGGRTIDIPIGDMLNPVYTTLNQLTASHRFPQLENASVLLNPNNFYDVKIRTSMPLVNSEVWYNKKMKQQAISLQEASVNVYKRALVKDVKTAYYRYFQSQKAIAIYKEAMTLVEQNIAMNESLLRNGVRNSTSLTRARTEQQKIQAQITEAENNSRNSRAYFNFLLNRPLETEIATDAADTLITKGPDGNAGDREELMQLDIKKQILNLNTQMQRANAIPRLSTFLDLGSQGFNWAVDDKSKYYLFGVNLEWNVFAWGKSHYKARQAALDVSATEMQHNQAAQAYALQLTQATNNYHTAISNYQSAQAQQLLAAKYHNDQQKAYKAGALLYIELLDAQNQLTAAKLQASVALANVQIALTDVERNAATYPLN